jgi:Protein of unknown function (DUF1588)/Protein of unknown function (DUF1592)/Protein of unknown function (DUF1585)
LSVGAVALLAATLFVGGTLGLSSVSSAAEPAKDSADSSIGTRAHLRLLTTQQYFNTIQYFFGPDITVDAKFSPLPRTDGVLMAGTSVGGVSDSQIELYQKIANSLSKQVVDARHRDSLIPCKPKNEKAADNACAGKFLTRVIDNLYFVSPRKEDVAKLTDEAGAAADRMHSFYDGLQVVLEGVLLSPDMLLVAESVEPDPKHPGHMRLDAESQASRLSLALWNSAPDPALRAAAKRGDLFDDKKRARIVDAMLASPRLESGVRSFFDDMFGLEGLETVSKDTAAYPYFLAGVAAEAREQTLRTVVDQLLDKNGDYRDLFTSRDTFVSPHLAILYGIPSLPGWRAYEFPPEAHRAGILTEASFLALNSQATRSSATLRGKALRELILCQNVPPPPPNVDFSAVDNPDASLKTARQQLDFHRKNPVCAGCHKIMDPIGLALENFDGAGRYRVDEKGAPIDASGSLDGKTFVDVEGLGQAVHDSPAVPACLVRRAFTYTTAGVVPPADKAVLADLSKTFADAHYHLRPLLRAIMLNPAFSDAIDTPPAAAAEKSASAAPPTKVASDR